MRDRCTVCNRPIQAGPFQAGRTLSDNTRQRVTAHQNCLRRHDECQ